jgi:hypothetical protein
MDLRVSYPAQRRNPRRHRADAPSVGPAPKLHIVGGSRSARPEPPLRAFRASVTAARVFRDLADATRRGNADDAEWFRTELAGFGWIAVPMTDRLRRLGAAR